MAQPPPTVLIVAGNDPSGGAGLAADQQAITAAGAHPAPVVTALTVQDTVNATEVIPADPALVARQMRAVMDDIPVGAVKIGLLATAPIAEAVADVLESRSRVPVVLDPVLVAAGGATLAEEALIDTLLTRLFPMASLVTPNALEIRRLAPDAPDQAARAESLLAHGCEWVLAKGGDEAGEDVVNVLYTTSTEPQVFRWRREPHAYHGSGCTLASACAARLALGDGVPEAVATAQALTQGWIAQAFRPGRGQHVPLRRPPGGS